jgi:large subunit ribosomal protein L37Ae
MERRTTKVGITGKYGTRYGAKLRKQTKAIEILQRTKYTCTFCGKNSIRRSAVGIWRCRACRRTIAGGAWEFATSAAQTARTTINRLKKVTTEVVKKVVIEDEQPQEEENKKTDKKNAGKGGNNQKREKRGNEKRERPNKKK